MYRAARRTSATASGTFRTAATPGQTFSFAMIGDFGGGGPGATQNAASIRAAGTDFTQTVGDNVYPSSGLPDPNFATTYSDFDQRFFKPFGPTISEQGFFPANGNKEYYGDGQWWDAFPMHGSNHSWYSYDWGDAHILVLDTEVPYSPGTEQYAFAEADLQASQNAKWRIVITHAPPYSSGSAGASSEGVQTHLVPLFQAQRVHLVASGNSHNYERTHPMRNGARAAADGVTYLVTGGGGNGFNTFSLAQPAYTAFREDTYYQYTKVTVSPTALLVEGRRADTGAVFDSATITPSSGDTTPPTAPSGLSATAVSSSQIDLAWTASTDAVGVTGYDVFRGGVQVATVSGTSASDTGLTPNTSYTYTVKARDAAGNVSPTSSAATTTTLSAGTGAQTTINASADARVQQANPTTNYGTSTTLGADQDPTAQVESFLKFANPGLTGTVTSAKLRLWTVPGTGSSSTTTNGPALYGVTQDWTEGSISYAARPTRAATATANVSALAADSVAEYDVTALVKNGTYNFSLVPDSTDGVSFNSRENSATTKRPQLVITTSSASGDTTPPTAPSGLSATAVSSSQIDLAWTASTDAVGVTGYDVFRGGVQVATVSGTSASDTGLTPNTSYTYTVKARDAAGNVSPTSSAATTTTLSAGTGAQTTINASADARVQQANPTTNYGTSTTLGADQDPTAQVESFLKFANPGLTGTVTSAKLRLWTVPGTGSSSTTTNGPALYGVTQDWTEGSISYAARPTRAATATANVSALAADSVAEYDVTALVKNGTYNFSLVPDSTDGVSFNSRENSATTKRPQLVITTG